VDTARNIIFDSDKCRCKKCKVAAKSIFCSEKLLLHVAGINAVAKSFARTINVTAKTNVLQQQLMLLPLLVFFSNN
jgi:hypothetical protein